MTEDVMVCCNTCKYGIRNGVHVRAICLDCGRKSVGASFVSWEICDREAERMKRLHPELDKQKFMDDFRKSIEEEDNHEED